MTLAKTNDCYFKSLSFFVIRNSMEDLSDKRVRYSMKHKAWVLDMIEAMVEDGQGDEYPPTITALCACMHITLLQYYNWMKELRRETLKRKVIPLE